MVHCAGPLIRTFIHPTTMSRLLLLIVCLGFGQFAAAQTYQRLIQPDKYWEIMECDRTLICNYTGGDRYHFDGDTLINGQTYAKMYRQALISQYGSNPYCPPFGVSPNIFLSYFFLREDTVAQRIYRYAPWDNLETLVFDLTMEAGDTLFLSDMWDYCVLDSITTTSFSDGVVRRVYHFDSAVFIEGVGSVGSLNGGPFYPPNTIVGHCDQLYCFEHNGAGLYPWINCGSGPLSTNEQSAEQDAAPHPNPASDQIRLPTISNGPAQVYIHDQLGRLVLRDDLLKENANVDIRGLRPGTYSYRMVAPDGTAMTGRFEVLR
jgi:hypothetical protein